MTSLASALRARVSSDARPSVLVCLHLIASRSWQLRGLALENRIFCGRGVACRGGWLDVIIRDPKALKCENFLLFSDVFCHFYVSRHTLVLAQITSHRSVELSGSRKDARVQQPDSTSLIFL